MKSRATKVFLIIAAILGLLSLLISIIIYLGPQELILRTFFSSQMPSVGRVINWPTLITDLIVFICYLLVFIIYVKSDSSSPAIILGLVLLIVIMAIKTMSPVFSIPMSQMLSRRGAEYLAVYSSVSSAHNLLCGSFSLLALVFYCMGFGTLCVRRSEG